MAGDHKKSYKNRSSRRRRTLASDTTISARAPLLDSMYVVMTSYMHWATNPNRSCRGLGPSMFFPEGPRKSSNKLTAWSDNIEDVREICFGCPVQMECLKHALDQPANVVSGIWGGVYFGHKEHYDKQHRRISLMVNAAKNGVQLPYATAVKLARRTA